MLVVYSVDVWVVMLVGYLVVYLVVMWVVP